MEKSDPTLNKSNNFQKGGAAQKSYGLRLVDQYIDFRGDIRDDIAFYLARNEIATARHKKSALMGKFGREEVVARAFYDTLVRPFLLKGTLNSGTKEKTFTPDQAYIDNFAHQLSNNGIPKFT